MPSCSSTTAVARHRESAVFHVSSPFIDFLTSSPFSRSTGGACSHTMALLLFLALVNSYRNGDVNWPKGYAPPSASAWIRERFPNRFATLGASLSTQVGDFSAEERTKKNKLQWAYNSRKGLDVSSDILAVGERKIEPGKSHVHVKQHYLAVLNAQVAADDEKKRIKKLEKDAKQRPRQQQAKAQGQAVIVAAARAAEAAEPVDDNPLRRERSRAKSTVDSDSETADSDSEGEEVATKRLTASSLYRKIGSGAGDEVGLTSKRMRVRKDFFD